MNTVKKISVAVIGALTLSTSVFAIEAKPTTSTVLVNGTEVKLDAYNIDDNNYFKLRDIAYVLSNTEKQFDVSYDETANAISITTGKAYTPVGGETMQGTSENTDAKATNSTVMKDGVEKDISAYNINDNNYFKLRDLGEKLNFGVDYDAETNSVVIDTQKSYNAKPAPKQIIMEDITDSISLPTVTEMPPAPPKPTSGPQIPAPPTPEEASLVGGK